MSFYGRILAFLSLRICIQLFLESDASFFKEIAFDNCLSARFFDIRVFALYSCRRIKSANAPSVSDQESERIQKNTPSITFSFITINTNSLCSTCAIGVPLICFDLDI